MRRKPGPLGRVRPPRGAKAGGIGGVGMIVLVLVSLYFGVDPTLLLQGIDSANVQAGQTYPQQAPAGAPPQNDERAQFVSVVLADTEDTWHELFRDLGRTYREPRLVLFTGQVSSACGFQQAAVGPFYCPADHKVYIDLSFYDDLRRKLGAPGDFAQAYVIAHEVGHHIQTLLGISDKVHAAKRRASQRDANALSVLQELQADCFAGVWGFHANRTRNLLEEGDIEEGLNAASAIGDDRLQKNAGRRVTPESFTHGTSAQRMHWFRRGLESGDPDACDTFSSGA